MKFPKSFFCKNCGTIYNIYHNDLRTEEWGNVMMYISKENPESEQLAKEFNFTPRMAQYYLKEYKKLTSQIIYVLARNEMIAKATILKLFYSGKTLSPKGIAKILNLAPQTIRNNIILLYKTGHLKKVDRGRYKISDLGRVAYKRLLQSSDIRLSLRTE